MSCVRSLPLLGLVACAFDPSGSVPGDGESLPDAAGDPSTDGPGAQGPPYSRALEIAGGAVAGGPHESFPLLVALEEDWLRHTSAGGQVAHPGGFDIGFSSDPGGLVGLDHELERYDGEAGRVIAWVRVPSLSQETVLYLRYGDATIAASREDAAAVFGGGYAGVWHMDGALADSTGNSGAATSSGSVTAPGHIGDGRHFPSSSSFIDAGSAAAHGDVFAGGGTAEAWFFATGWGGGSYGRLFDKGHQSGWSMGVSNNSPSRSFYFVRGATSNYGHWNTPVGSIELDRWIYVAVVYDQGSVSNDAVMYIDGEEVDVSRVVTPGGSIVSDASSSLYFGNRPGLDRRFAGILDALRLSSVPRSAGWVATTFRNQSEASAFLIVGPETPGQDDGAGRESVQ